MQQKDTKTNLAARREKGSTTWGYTWGKLGLRWIMAVPGCFTLRLDIQLFQNRSLIFVRKTWMCGGRWGMALLAEQLARDELTWSVSNNIAMLAVFQPSFSLQQTLRGHGSKFRSGRGQHRWRLPVPNRHSSLSMNYFSSKSFVYNCITDALYPSNFWSSPLPPSCRYPLY
jgi:hypothetical protein